MAGPLLNSSSPFSVSARAGPGEVLVIASGEFDLACGPAVAAALAGAVTPACRRAVIDARAVTFIDCAGLRALLAPPPGWEGEWEVVLRAPSRPVRRLIALTQACSLVDAECLDANKETQCVMSSHEQWHGGGR